MCYVTMEYARAFGDLHLRNSFAGMSLKLKIQYGQMNFNIVKACLSREIAHNNYSALALCMALILC